MIGQPKGQRLANTGEAEDGSTASQETPLPTLPAGAELISAVATLANLGPYGVPLKSLERVPETVQQLYAFLVCAWETARGGNLAQRGTTQFPRLLFKPEHIPQIWAHYEKEVPHLSWILGYRTFADLKFGGDSLPNVTTSIGYLAKSIDTHGPIILGRPGAVYLLEERKDLHPCNGWTKEGLPSICGGLHCAYRELPANTCMNFLFFGVCFGYHNVCNVKSGTIPCKRAHIEPIWNPNPQVKLPTADPLGHPFIFYKLQNEQLPTGTPCPARLCPITQDKILKALQAKAQMHINSNVAELLYKEKAARAAAAGNEFLCKELISNSRFFGTAQEPNRHPPTKRPRDV